MKKKEMKTKVMAVAMSATMAASICPAVPAMAVTKDQVAKDGTYMKTAHVTRTEDDDEDEWNEYDVRVALTVKDGKFSDIVVTPENGYESGNDSYFNKAYSKSKGIKSKLAGQSATEDTINSWDTVSTATRSSDAIKKAALEAIQSAPEASTAATVDTAALEASITKAKALKESDYTAETWNTLKTALASAETALAEKKSQDTVDAAKKNLDSAIDNLKADNKKLTVAENSNEEAFNTYIGNITSVNVNGTDYAASGRGSVKIIDKDGTLVTDAAPFKDALAGTEFQITVTSTGYTTPLTFTYKVPGETPAPSEVDTTKLAAAIEKAEGLNESDYTKDSWKALQSELTKAKSALEAKESQDTVDKAADSLNKAIDALEAATPDEPTKEVSTDALEKAIKAAGALKESDYTADSWKALQSALAEADTALKEKKDQDTVDKATEKLNKAISALVKKDAGQKVNGTNGTTGTSGKSGKTGSTSNTKSGKAAKTGDPSSMFAWLGLAVTSLGAGIGGFSLKRKKREDEE